MSASAPWSVKGIDAKAREVAKDLARRSGMTLGEWLNQMILEGQDVGALISRETARDTPRPQRPTATARPPYADDRAYAEAAGYREAPRRGPVAAYDEDDDGYAAHPVRPPYREPLRRPPPFSAAAQPLGARDLRRSIFEGRPRGETHEDEAYASASGDLGRVARALEGLGTRIEGSEARSANAVRGVSHAVESLLDRLERSEAAYADTQDKLDSQGQEVRSSFERLGRAEEDQNEINARLQQAERLIDAQAERLEGLSGHVREDRERVARFEEQLKSPQAIETVRAVEGALGKLANQLYEGDVRTRETMKDVREDMVGLSHRLAQVELRDPERAAQAVIDKVVARMAQRLETAEAHTTSAIKTLEQAFMALDKRLTAAEGQGDISDPETARSFRQLAADLSRRVEDSRAELLGAMQAGVAPASEQALKALDDRIGQSEKHSAAAIDRLGQDVLRVAEGLNRRVSSVETAGKDNLNRVAAALESRIGRGESHHGQALERLSGEIARISERLSQKLAESERRAASVLGGVGEQIEQQRDLVREDLATRIRDSEARTAKLLEEARARIDQKLAHVQTQSLLSETVIRAGAPARDSADLPNPFGHQAAVAPAEGEMAPTVAPPAAPSPEVEVGSDEEIDLTGRLLAPVSDFKPDFDPFEDEEDFSAELMSARPVAARPAPGHSTPIDEDDDADPFADIAVSRKTAPAARETRPAASFAARGPRPPVAESSRFKTPADNEGLIFEDDQEPAPVSLTTRDALAAARAAVRASIEGEDATLGALRPGVRTRDAAPQKAKAAVKPQAGNTLMNAIKASSLAVVLVGGGAVGYVALKRMDHRQAPERTPIAAAAVTVADSQNNDLQSNLKAQYDMAVQSLEAHDPSAAAKLTAVAEQGYAPAEYRLGNIYDKTYGVLTKSTADARKWTEKAAEGGLPDAMNNYAMMYYSGDGGPQDRVMAAMWFRKAAERGQKDSQYNLGLLYQSGDGVAINPSEAYKWLSLAAKSGDGEAAKAAGTVRTQLSDAQRQKADDQVTAFVPISDGAPPMDASAVSQG